MHAPSAFSRPVLQAVMVQQAESFICRRCRTNPPSSHESFDSPYHFHPEVEIILLEDSRGTCYVADAIEPYAPGDFFMIGANVPHVFVREALAERAPPHPETSVVLQFRTDFLGESFLARPELRDVRELITSSANGLRFSDRTSRWVAPRLEKLLVQKGARRIALVLEILDHLAQAKGRPLASGALAKQIDPKDFVRLDRVLAHLAAHYPREITLTSVARIAALGPTSFSRWFKQATSKSFIECLTEIRLGHAYRLLTETGRNVTEIAFDCGFNSVSHFNHRFQQVRGMTPSEFRRRARSGRTAA